MSEFNVLIVDDSPFMRRVFSDVVDADDAFKVQATASNGYEAVDLVLKLKPDIITMDLEMPKMNGLEALQRIMAIHPVPIIMLSAVTDNGTRDTIKALQYGAFDFIRKPDGAVKLDIHQVGIQLLEKLHIAVEMMNGGSFRMLPAVEEISEPPFTFEPVELVSKLEEPLQVVITPSPSKEEEQVELVNTDKVSSEISEIKNSTHTLEKEELVKLNRLTPIPPAPAINRGISKLKQDVTEKAAEISRNQEITKKSAAIGKESPTKPNPTKLDPTKLSPSKPLSKTVDSPEKPKPKPKPKEELAQPKNHASAIFTHLVGIGTSTGGPRALHEVLTGIPADFPAPILVVQHMPPKFTHSLAQRLDNFCSIHVREAVDGELVETATAYIAPGGKHMSLNKDVQGKYRIRLTEEGPRAGHMPSVDVLFESLIGHQQLKRHIVLMTGMGSDGARGMKALQDDGALTTIAEAEETCVVYGMPRSAVELGAVSHLLPLQGIASTLTQIVKFRK